MGDKGTDGCTGLPKWFNVDFELCCKAHDCWYDRGGNEAIRKKGDVYFRHCIVRNQRNRWKMPYYFIVAWIAYFLVRIGGAKHFNYHNKIYKSRISK